MKESDKKKTLDYVRVPKGAKLQRGKKGYRVKHKGKTGVWFKGYSVVRAPTWKSALAKKWGIKLK
jgi:hypothetical protein